MVHAVYSNRDVFLRELISNGADACEKLRMLALTAPELAAGDAPLRVVLSADKAAGTMSVEDNGIGMSREELIDALGTIARSGTRAFIDSLAEANRAASSSASSASASIRRSWWRARSM